VSAYGFAMVALSSVLALAGAARAAGRIGIAIRVAILGLFVVGMPLLIFGGKP